MSSFVIVLPSRDLGGDDGEALEALDGMREASDDPVRVRRQVRVACPSAQLVERRRCR